MRPTPLEIATGLIFGEDPSRETVPSAAEATPIALLEKAVLPALEHPPCLVSFSGGLDSSSVLAAAVRAARREGLTLPVPITYRFRDAPLSEESDWQELVVRHLALNEWEICELGGDLDWIGDTSAAVLRRHGVLYPPNAFMYLPLLKAARGGSLLTGIGGDEILRQWRSRQLADLLARRRAPAPRDLLRLGYAAVPRAVRRRVAHRRERDLVPSWLRPGARRAILALAVKERVKEPLYWDRWIRLQARGRALAVSRRSMALLARDVGSILLHPLLDPRFVGAVARSGGRLGFGDRRATMQALFADALPAKLLARSTKALFDEALWRTNSREFARSWDGSGVDPLLVDPAALREEWLKPKPDARSTLLLQSAWLNQDGATG